MVKIYEPFWSDDTSLPDVSEVIPNYYPPTRQGNFCYRFRLRGVPSLYVTLLTPGDYFQIGENKYLNKVLPQGLIKELCARYRRTTPFVQAPFKQSTLPYIPYENAEIVKLKDEIEDRLQFLKTNGNSLTHEAINTNKERLLILSEKLEELEDT